MKRLVFALLVCGLGAMSFGQPYATFTKLMVLKGTCSDTAHYVLNDPDPTATLAQRTAYGVDALALSIKPKVYYFLVVEVTYAPQFTDAGKWTGEGTLGVMDLWTLGAVQYGIGKHDANGVYDKALKYAYDIGLSDPFWLGNSYWYWPKAKQRLADASILSVDEGDTFRDSREGTALMAFSPKLIKDRATGDSWYEPNISSITIYHSQLMQQLIGATPEWKYVQMGSGKIVFKLDSKMTAKANLTDLDTGDNIGLAQVAADIQALLVKGGYGDVLPDLDPFDYYTPTR